VTERKQSDSKEKKMKQIVPRAITSPIGSKDTTILTKPTKKVQRKKLQFLD
jgi:hypothetical protein